MRLNELYENPDNPSKATDEQLERLAGKLKRVPLGLTAMRIAYVTDREAGKKMVISGNKRLRVLKKAYGDDAELPDEWFQDVTAMSEAERHEFIVTANVSDGDWDIDKLLQQYDTSLLNTLMGSEEVDKLVQEAASKTAVRDSNAVPEVQGAPVSEIDKTYQLGRHKLICGDSTKKETFEKLLEGKKADLVVTDPPYNIDKQGGTKDRLTIMNDNMEDSEFMKFLEKVWSNIEWSLKDGGVFYVWMADGGPDGEFEMALRKAKRLHQSMPLVWVKDTATFSMGRLDYNRRHEPCKFGWKTGAAHCRCMDLALNTILQDDTPDFEKMKKEELVQTLKKIYEESTSVMNQDRPRASRLHPTMKPVELIKKQILNSSRVDEIVLDLFLGSGTTLIAAEESGRTCYGVEFDPHYCDVIRKRWAEFVYGEGCDWQKLTPEIKEEIEAL